MATSIKKWIPNELLIFAKTHNMFICFHENERIMVTKIGPPEEPEGNEVCIKNLPKNLYENDILPYFMRMGKIYKTRLVFGEDGIFTQGIAYIKFESSIAAELALNLNNCEMLRGFNIIVERVAENRRLFLGGIPDFVTKEQILQELIQTGFENISHIILYPSYNTDFNKNRGYAFVEFENMTAAQKAFIKFEKCALFGRRCNLDWARPVDIIPTSVMKNVKILFFKNINILDSRIKFIIMLKTVLTDFDLTIVKVYRKKNYAFVHFTRREYAETAMYLLKEYFKSIRSFIKVEWAKPPPNRLNPKDSNNPNDVTEYPREANGGFPNPVHQGIMDAVPRTFSSFFSKEYIPTNEFHGCS